MFKILFFCLMLVISCISMGETNYAQVDRYAKNAPPLKTDNGLPNLVKYLIKPFSRDDEKARVLMAWIVYNLEYDEKKAKYNNDPDVALVFEIENDPETGEPHLKRGDLKILKEQDTIQKTLKMRKGVCKDIARLYQHMCQLAGLEAVVVNGYACDTSQKLKTSEAHMWNAVKINGKWSFMDPTWALQGRLIVVSNEEEAKKIERQIKRGRDIDKISGIQKKVADAWFMVDNEEMIKTHFPFERRWQLQRQRTTFEEFLEKSCHTTFKEFLQTM